MRSKLLIFCMAAAWTGCAVGPNYQRPAVPAPPQFRADLSQPTQPSLGDLKWFDVFKDEALRDLIKEALDANYDIRIATQRALAAQGQLEATRSGLFPQLGGPGNIYRNGIQAPIQSAGIVGFGSSWELDLFGKLRRSTEAARADLLASDENKRAVIQALVAEVATGYFDLLDYDTEIGYVTDSIATRQESLRLVVAREEGGVGSLLEVDQAQTLVATAQASLAALEKGREQTENIISFLVGRQPGPVTRGASLVDQKQPPEVPAGLPSALLDRRPDIRGAEQQLVAANARVGVAKAAFYPSITLTGNGGYGTTDLLGIATRSGPAFAMGAILDLPIFDAGRRRGNYHTAQAQHEELLINYQKTINGAFRDVSDALIGYQKNKEFTKAQTLLAETLRDQTKLANQRYIGGVSSYLEVLDTERQRLTAEQQLAQAQRDVLTSLVDVYKALGGGWQ
jgi:multidrug efflux system outer membrane protein